MERSARTNTARIRRVLTALASAGALSMCLAAPVTAAPPPGGPGGYEAPTGCVAGAASNFDISVADDGDVHLVFHDDGLNTCNEVVHVQSWASNGLTVDMHAAPPLGNAVPTMAELEQAGPAGITVSMQIDPCYTAITVLRDGDTRIFDDIIGDGCDLTIVTDFAGAGHPAQLHVVQQTGVIAPPHFIDVAADDTTVLEGLPNGTWYVKVYDGWTTGSTIEVDTGGPQAASTVYDVADGSLVEVDLAAPKWIAPRLQNTATSDGRVPTLSPATRLQLLRD